MIRQEEGGGSFLGLQCLLLLRLFLLQRLFALQLCLLLLQGKLCLTLIFAAISDVRFGRSIGHCNHRAIVIRRVGVRVRRGGFNRLKLRLRFVIVRIWVEFSVLT